MSIMTRMNAALYPPIGAVPNAVQDYAGNNDGTNFRTTVAVVDGRVGLEFDDVSQNQVDIPLVEVAGDFTISVWLNFDADGDFGGRGQMFISEDGTRSTFIRVRDIDGIEFANKNDNDRASWDDTGVDFKEWRHLSFVGSEDVVELFIDGISHGARGLVNNITINVFGTGWTQDHYFMKGLMSDVRIWNTARTQSEIQADMNKRLTGNEPGLVGYWPMAYSAHL